MKPKVHPGTACAAYYVYGFQRTQKAAQTILISVRIGVSVPGIDGGLGFGTGFGIHKGQQGLLAFRVTAGITDGVLAKDTDRLSFGIILQDLP